MKNRTLLAALAGLAFAAPAVIALTLAPPAAAQSSLSVTIGTPPPPVRYEVVPAPRAGYIWAPGFWRWDGHHHVWAEGHWVAERHGYRWAPDRWEHDHEGWHYVPGHWNHG
jgi:hypothetical protein